MRDKLLLAAGIALAACLAGMALGVVGYLTDAPWIVDVGEVMTVGWTVIMGVLVAGFVLAAIAAPLAWAWERIRAPGRRRR